jgi:TPP-dependent pyruvate/acetoin dehydrogenase alpha subunit
MLHLPKVCFRESINAIGVLRCPAIVTVYDDGYGISVANESQIARKTSAGCWKVSAP